MRVVFLTPQQIEQTVVLLNAILDLEDFNDAEEAVIFRHAVCSVIMEIERLLPRPFLKLLLHAHPTDGLGQEQSKQLCQRLREQVGEAIDLPYLSARHEGQVVSCVVELVVGATGKGLSFDDMLAIERSGPMLSSIRYPCLGWPPTPSEPLGPR